MSTQDAERLLKELSTNSALKEKLKSAGAGGFEKTAAAAGFHVTREDFANAVKAVVVSQDLAGPKGFQVVDGIVSGVGSGVSSHVSTAVTGVA